MDGLRCNQNTITLCLGTRSLPKETYNELGQVSAPSRTCLRENFQPQRAIRSGGILVDAPKHASVGLPPRTLACTQTLWLCPDAQRKGLTHSCPFAVAHASGAAVLVSGGVSLFTYSTVCTHHEGQQGYIDRVTHLLISLFCLASVCLFAARSQSHFKPGKPPATPHPQCNLGSTC